MRIHHPKPQGVLEPHGLNDELVLVFVITDLKEPLNRLGVNGRHFSDALRLECGAVNTWEELLPISK